MQASHRSRRRAGRFVVAVILGAGLPAAAASPAATPRDAVGTWTGSSTCVGDRPACKNETVVYRFVPVDGKPDRVRLLADKILEGKRVPMGALDCENDAANGRVRCEFTRGRTHGVWLYVVNGDAMTGTLEVLPERTIGRDVKVRRVADAEVPPAPALHEYDE